MSHVQVLSAEYKIISPEDGIKYYPKSESLYISTDSKFWATPVVDRCSRCRTYHEKKLGKISKSLRVNFHLSEDEFKKINISKNDSEIFLYGAYHEENGDICQLKSDGHLGWMTDDEIKNFKEVLNNRLTSGDRDDPIEQNGIDRFLIKKMIETGYYLYFEPKTYYKKTFEK